MSNFIPLNCKTHYSLQKGFCKNGLLAGKCVEYGYKACGIADIKSLSGAVDFHQQCEKNGIKPIIGCDFDDYLLFAKNKRGWFDLINYVSEQSLDNLKKFAANGNLLCVSLKSNGFKKLFKKNHFQYDYKQHQIYYVTEDEAECHRIMLCAGMKTTLKKVNKLINDDKEVDNKRFFENSKFYLPKPEDVSEDYKILQQISDACEEYEVAEKPMLPTFDCPEGLEEDDYLTQLCRKGWKKRLMNSDKISTEQTKKEYGDRVKHELKVIFKAQLSGYFSDCARHNKFCKKEGLACWSR